MSGNHADVNGCSLRSSDEERETKANTPASNSHSRTQTGTNQRQTICPHCSAHFPQLGRHIWRCKQKELPANAEKKRHKWTHEENKKLVGLYFASNPQIIGWRKRLATSWHSHSDIEKSEQNLAGQVNSLLSKKYFTADELNILQERNPYLLFVERLFQRHNLFD